MPDKASIFFWREAEVTDIGIMPHFADSALAAPPLLGADIEHEGPALLEATPSESTGT